MLTPNPIWGLKSAFQFKLNRTTKYDRPGNFEAFPINERRRLSKIPVKIGFKAQEYFSNAFSRRACCVNPTLTTIGIQKESVAHLDPFVASHLTGIAVIVEDVIQRIFSKAYKF